MDAHFIFLIAHAAQSIEHGGIGQGTRFRAHRRKQIFARAGPGLQLPQNRHNLCGQRHNMRTSHFHAFCRNAPFRGFQIKLAPLCGP